VLVVLGLVVILMVVGMIYPAVWSCKWDVPDGRLDLPDRILRWRC
jgi:hypothetical protein